MKNHRLTMFLLVFVTVSSGYSLAHKGATGIVKQRMEAMSDIGKQMKAMAAMLKGELAFDANAIQDSANVIAGHARNIPDMFPEGSNNKPSEALPVVWSRWDDFIKLGSKMEASAASLAKAASSARSMAGLKDQIIAVGRSCKSCHRDFRQAK